MNYVACFAGINKTNKYNRGPTKIVCLRLERASSVLPFTGDRAITELENDNLFPLLSLSYYLPIFVVNNPHKH